MRELLAILWDGPFAMATWVDWVDITVLAVLIYGLIRFVRGTRAGQSMLGLGLVGAVYLLSDLLGLSALHYVLDNVFVYAVLAIIILFQEDIRRVLARAGERVFTPSGGAALTDANLIEEINKALFALATRRIGALVAVQRSAALDAYVEGTHTIDAVVSTELLQSIFHPASPIHDGAVVIARGRIAWAGVFLPVSLAKNLPKNYGTRHRAAIGLTERSDALCLLVSEERGTVAVIDGGVITPVADANELRQQLQERLGMEAAKEVASA